MPYKGRRRWGHRPSSYHRWLHFRRSYVFLLIWVIGFALGFYVVPGLTFPKSEAQNHLTIGHIQSTPAVVRSAMAVFPVPSRVTFTLPWLRSSATEWWTSCSTVFPPIPTSWSFRKVTLFVNR